MKFRILCLILLLMALSVTLSSADQSIGFKKEGEKGSLVYYTGSIIIEGKFSYSNSVEAQEILGDHVCFYPIEKDGKLIPREDDQRIPWFCFKDTKKAKDLFGISELITDFNICKITGKATVEIKDYVVDKTETEAHDTAELVRVIEKSKPTLMRRRTSRGTSIQHAPNICIPPNVSQATTA
jgi:hypothetical protein